MRRMREHCLPSSCAQVLATASTSSALASAGVTYTLSTWAGARHYQTPTPVTATGGDDQTPGPSPLPAPPDDRPIPPVVPPPGPPGPPGREGERAPPGAAGRAGVAWTSPAGAIGPRVLRRKRRPLQRTAHRQIQRATTMLKLSLYRLLPTARPLRAQRRSMLMTHQTPNQR